MTSTGPLLAIAALIAIPRAAVAEDDCRDLIVSGKSAVAAKKWGEGRGYLFEAYETCRDPVTLIHISKSFQDEGDRKEALKYAEMFLREAPRDHPLRKVISEAVKTLRRMIAEEEAASASEAPGPSASEESSEGEGKLERRDLSGEAEDADLTAAPAGRADGALPFLLLDRTSERSVMGADLGVAPSVAEGTRAARLEIHLAHLLTRELGIIAAFPIALLSTSEPASETSVGLGGLDVGAFYIARLGTQADLALRLSILVATAPQDDFLTNGIAGATIRLGDSLGGGIAGIARTSGSLIYHFGPRASARLDVALETPLYARAGLEVDHTPLGRGGLGIAFGAKTIGFLEAVTIYNSEAEDAIYQLGGGIAQRIGPGAIKLGASIIAGIEGADTGDSLAFQLSYVATYRPRKGR